MSDSLPGLPSALGLVPTEDDPWGLVADDGFGIPAPLFVRVWWDFERGPLPWRIPKHGGDRLTRRLFVVDEKGTHMYGRRSADDVALALWSSGALVQSGWDRLVTSMHPDGHNEVLEQHPDRVPDDPDYAAAYRACYHRFSPGPKHVLALARYAVRRGYASRVIKLAREPDGRLLEAT